MNKNKMGYAEANIVRRTGLLSLIAKNKFENQQPLGKSIRGAISDKLQARAAAIREKYDLLNLVAALTGSGVIGKSIRTLAGRAMGRSEEDIKYFGGYSKKRKKRRIGGQSSSSGYFKVSGQGMFNRKVRDDGNDSDSGSNRMNAEKLSNGLYNTNVSQGQNNKLQKGDGLASIMAKLYNLFLMNIENERKELQIERNFKKTKEKDKDKWNEELIEAITGNKTKKSRVKKSTASPTSFSLTDILGIVSKMIDVAKALMLVAITKAIKPFEKLLKLIKPAAKPVIKAAEKTGAKVATKTVKKVAEKSVSKAATKTAIKTAAKVAEKQTAKIIQKSAVKTGEKTIAKALIKKIPFIGLAAGLVFGAQRLYDGDSVGAGLEIASGAASILPVAGTATSVAIDVGLASRDFGAFDKKTQTAKPVPPKPPQNRAPNVKPVIPNKSTPIPAQPSTSGQRVQKSINKNNDLKIDEMTAPKIVSIDNSKTITAGTGGGSSPLIMDTSVDVRIDDDTLNSVMQNNYRPV